MEEDSAVVGRLTDSLRRQSRLLERVQRIAQIGGWELNLQTQELTWTDETYHLHGVTRESYFPTVETAIEFYTPQAQPIIRKALRAAIQQAEQYDLELQIIRPDAAVRWVRAIGRRNDEDGEPHILCGVFQDVTDRRLLEQEILSVGQRERTLLGFDLHDGLGQELTGALFLVGAVFSEIPASLVRARADLKKLEGIIQSSLDSCRALAAGASPTDPSRGGLLAAVQSLADWTATHHSLAIHIRARGHDWALEGPVADHLFRIVQEAMTNAIKHGHAHHITVAIESTAKRCLVSIRDDGQTPPDSASNGMGLKIMQYRARLIGAHFTVKSFKGGGFRVRCCLARQP